MIFTDQHGNIAATIPEYLSTEVQGIRPVPRTMPTDSPENGCYKRKIEVSWHWVNPTYHRSLGVANDLTLPLFLLYIF